MGDGGEGTKKGCKEKQNKKSCQEGKKFVQVNNYIITLSLRPNHDENEDLQPRKRTFRMRLQIAFINCYSN